MAGAKASSASWFPEIERRQRRVRRERRGQLRAALRAQRVVGGLRLVSVAFARSASATALPPAASDRSCAG